MSLLPEREDNSKYHFQFQNPWGGHQSIHEPTPDELRENYNQFDPLSISKPANRRAMEWYSRLFIGCSMRPTIRSYP
jgi:hypothetical protein